MTALIAGLLLFVGVHSVGMLAPQWRLRQIDRLGAMRWRGGYSLVSALGFALMVWGYGLARQNPLLLWDLPASARLLNAGLMLVSMLLLAAYMVPRNHIQARLHHPMNWATVVFALAHLLVNNTLADLLLFGCLLLWALALLGVAYQRDAAQARPYGPARWWATSLSGVLGLALYAVFVKWLHLWLIGLSVLPH